LIYLDNHTKHINTSCKHDVELLMLK